MRPWLCFLGLWSASQKRDDGRKATSEESETIVERSLYAAGTLELLQRATRAEVDLAKVRGNYEKIVAEREIFIRERDAEMEVLERATEQTQKTQARLAVLEEELAEMAGKLERSDAKQVEFQRVIADKSTQLEVFEQDLARQEREAEDAAEIFENVNLQLNDALRREADVKGEIRNARRDNAGLQNLLKAQDRKARAALAQLEQGVKKWRSRAEEAERASRDQTRGLLDAASLIWRSSSFMEATLQAEAAETRLQSRRQVEEATALRRQAEAEARTRTTRALRAAAERRAAEEDLLEAKAALNDLQLQEAKLQEQTLALEQELNNLPSLAKRLSRRVWFRFKQAPSFTMNRVVRPLLKRRRRTD
mmetsp:Transcript_36479/g.116935  ORF Transcript_36479/g.116935 Transcript_36479/m.116935 type:complete len:365 (+) Transcript_36479:21-1115(+)